MFPCTFFKLHLSNVESLKNSKLFQNRSMLVQYVNSSPSKGLLTCSWAIKYRNCNFFGSLRKRSQTLKYISNQLAILISFNYYYLIQKRKSQLILTPRCSQCNTITPSVLQAPRGRKEVKCCVSERMPFDTPKLQLFVLRIHFPATSSGKWQLRCIGIIVLIIFFKSI